MSQPETNCDTLMCHPLYPNVFLVFRFRWKIGLRCEATGCEQTMWIVQLTEWFNSHRNKAISSDPSIIFKNASLA